MSFKELDSAVQKYREHFKSEPSACSCAPGRVNLIGEHTDYNDGYVFPMALDLFTIIIGAKNDTNRCHIVTINDNVDEPRNLTFELPSDGQQLSPGKPKWANYIKGVMANYNGKLHGYNALIMSTVPVGGGLSSSAAIEVSTFLFLEALNGTKANQSLEEKAKACQKAEHKFCNVPCGIMDQFISFMGKEGHALLLDCRSLDYNLVPFNDEDIAILITNTNVRHELASSEYAIRKGQCEEAAKIIGKSSLRDVTLEELEACQSKMSEVLFRRAKHVISEMQRTLKSANALHERNYLEFGLLMKQSHESLNCDYEVSCPELNEVVNAALHCDGVYGSRMTGGGFGGCVVTLLKKCAIPTTIETIKEKYKGNPTFHVCSPSKGAQIIPL